MSLWRCLFLLLPLVAIVNATETDDTKIEYYNNLAKKNLARKLKTFKEMHDGRLPKNIIIFIGDGMGIPAVSSARLYKAEKANKPGEYSRMPFAMEGFHSAGFSKTASWSHHVTDSSAGAIAPIRGIKVDNNLAGVKPGAKSDCLDDSAIPGEENTAELALLKNLAVGSVTTVTMTHATPAALFAKSIHRSMEHDIPKFIKEFPTCEGHDLALQVLDFPANKFRVVLGGGAQHFLPNTTAGGLRADGRDVMAEWAKLPGTRKVVRNRDDLMKVKTDEADLHLLGAFDPAFMTPPLLLTEQEKAKIPSLMEMTEKAIEILSQNEKGYFLMVEGGQIDIYEHKNQMKVSGDELLEFDDAIKRAREMTKRDETLIIITADHSHSLMIGEFEKKTDSMHAIGQEKKGIALSHGPGHNRTGHDLQSPEYRVPAMFLVDSGHHGGDHVPIYSDGPYSWLFSSTIENTEIGYLMKSLLCLSYRYCLTNKENLNPVYKKTDEKEEQKEKDTTCTIGWIGGATIVILGFIQLFGMVYWSYAKRNTYQTRTRRTQSSK